MLHRRDAMLRLGQLGMAGLTLPQMLNAQKTFANSSQHRVTPSADACIYLFLWGGPPQQDMWDMKPDAPAGIRSQFGMINSVVPGITVSDQMPLFARQTDKTCIVRTLTHGSNNHEPSVYHLLTGRQNPTLVVPRNQRNRREFPFFGSVVSHFERPSAIPATMTIPRPIGHDGVTYSGTYAGFLGPRHDPFEQAPANYSNQQAAHPTTLLPDLGLSRVQARHGLLKLLEEQDRALQAGKFPGDLDDNRHRAMEMVASSAVRKALNLESEPPALRDRYGRNEYGEAMLLCRRLVEAGVKVVSLAWMHIATNGKAYNVWDNHGAIDTLGKLKGFDHLKANFCIPPLDRGMSALLEDLADRGMLQRTLVCAVGEFGRTPQINPNQGREHWGACQSAILAGGGIKGGTVHGKSDKIAAYPKESPVSPEDFLATIYHAMGLAPEAEVPDREGRPHRIVEGGRPVLSLFE